MKPSSVALTSFVVSFLFASCATTNDVASTYAVDSLRDASEEELTYMEATTADDLLAFIRRYPDSEHVPAAEQRLASWAYVSASTEEELRAFIHRYPDSEHIRAARERLALKTYAPTFNASENTSENASQEELASYRDANTADDLLAFIRRYPDSEHVRTAEQRLASWAYLSASTAEELRAFIHRYPDSEHVPAAEQLLANWPYPSAKTEDELRAFVDEYPNSPFVDVALERLNKLDDREKPWISMPITKWDSMSVGEHAKIMLDARINLVSPDGTIYTKPRMATFYTLEHQYAERERQCAEIKEARREFPVTDEVALDLMTGVMRWSSSKATKHSIENYIKIIYYTRDVKDQDGNTLLHIALNPKWYFSPDVDPMEGATGETIILEPRFLVDMAVTALKALSGRGDLVEMLLSNCADVKAVNSSGLTPLHYISRTPRWLSEAGNFEMLRKPGFSSIEWKTENTMFGDGPAIVRDTISKRSSTLLVGTPSLEATLTSIIQQLVEAGADINAKDKEGMTPLHAAIMVGTREAVVALIRNGADVNVPVSLAGEELSPLFLANMTGRDGIADVLRRNGGHL